MQTKKDVLGVVARLGSVIILGVSAIAVSTALLPPAALASDGTTWTQINLPNVAEHPDQPDLWAGQAAPYTIRWPGEGTTSSASGDCDTIAPYRNGRRARSDLLQGVQGIWKNGPFVRVGSGSTGINHLAIFFHTPDNNGQPCFAGGDEYGFTRKLNEGTNQTGDAPLKFYQCHNCNTPTQQYSAKVVWNYAGSARIYRVRIQQDNACPLPYGNFFVEVVRPDNFQVVHSETVCRSSWMPNLHGVSGWITANARADGQTGDGVDKFDGSYNQVDGVKYFH